MSVKSHLTFGAPVHPENTVTYSAGNGGPKICGVFPETASLQRSSTPSIEGHTYSWPFSCGKHAHAYYSIYHMMGAEGSALLVHSLPLCQYTVSLCGKKSGT